MAVGPVPFVVYFFKYINGYDGIYGGWPRSTDTLLI